MGRSNNQRSHFKCAIYSGGVTPFVIPFQVSLCQTDPLKGCAFDALYRSDLVFFSKDKYQECRSIDTCADLNVDNIPCRQYSKFQALLFDDVISALERKERNEVSAMKIVIMFYLSFTILQCLVAMIESQWAPEHLRNEICLRLTGSSDCNGTTLIRRYRYYIGKYLAGFSYLLAILVFVTSQIAFVSSVEINEITTWPWPTEEYDAIGQINCSNS